MGARRDSRTSEAHTFSIGQRDFLLDGRPFQIRSGELHAARIPREYWPHRLRMVRAMGCNTVCMYLFWNQHEPRPGTFDFTGQADAAEYCRLAQQEGLKVILRPGPYSCAEWDLGGLPWWLLKTPGVRLRTRDPSYLEAAKRYLARVGQELAPLQITRGGPIILVQVENEYGSYGDDKEYIGILRDCLRDAGFDVPFFTCDGPSQLRNDVREDIFSAVNFGSDPARNFEALRAIRPSGPLMCGEYYPGWFDSWGQPHHTGDTPRLIRELTYMLEQGASFSMYMAHGGTSFGFSSGANSPPFRPQSTSYDYDAPIDEAGRPTAKFHAIRELFLKHLLPGETLPDVPAANPVIAVPPIAMTEYAPLFDHLGTARREAQPRSMELYDQAHGLILYRTTLESERSGVLTITDPHDIAQVFLDGRRVGVLDRRWRQRSLTLPAGAGKRLDILVEALGRINFGADIHDRKGITEGVTFQTDADGSAVALNGWEVFCLPLDDEYLASLRFRPLAGPIDAPAVYRGESRLATLGDTYLDMRDWSRGMVWINGHNLGRYWNIGPQQTLYVPGCWLREGRNDVVVLDVACGIQQRRVQGLAQPILDELRPDPHGPSRHRRMGQTLNLTGVAPVHDGRFALDETEQRLTFAPVRGRFVCLDALDSHNNDAFTTLAELYLLDDRGRDLPRDGWRIVYADSEELSGDDGSAINVLDGDSATFWHTEWEAAQPRHPHQIVIDLGAARMIGGLRCLPRQDSRNGRIAAFRLYVSQAPPPGCESK